RCRGRSLPRSPVHRPSGALLRLHSLSRLPPQTLGQSDPCQRRLPRHGMCNKEDPLPGSTTAGTEAIGSRPWSGPPSHLERSQFLLLASEQVGVCLPLLRKVRAQADENLTRLDTPGNEILQVVGLQRTDRPVEIQIVAGSVEISRLQ